MSLSILDSYSVTLGDLNWNKLEEITDLKIFQYTQSDEVLSQIGTSDGILICKTKITEDIIKKSPNLKYIGVNATGYDGVDLIAAKKAGICVTNIPSYSTMAVAQHTMALMLNFTNSVALHNDSVQNGKWQDCKIFTYTEQKLIELYGKTLGIIGYGSIGKQVAKIAYSMGMKVIFVPHNADSLKNTKNDIYATPVTMNELLKESDFISLHTPLTAETRNLINKQLISQMKNGVYIINTSRGLLVNEDDIAENLENGKIAGYAADVLSKEPMSAECKLQHIKNCIITPHIAWAPTETRQRLINIAICNYISWLEGKPENQVC